jgi:transposase
VGALPMFIDLFKNNGIDYLRLAQSYRAKNSKGKTTTRRTVVLNIGPFDKFDDGMPNYLNRLRTSFKAGNPLIAELEPYCAKEAPRETYAFDFVEGDTFCFGLPKIFSHLLIERILEELGLMNFFSAYKGFTKIQYDVYSFAKLMIFGRILNPASKLATTRQNDDYYEPILDREHNPDNIYDTLDFIADNHNKIIRRMNTNLIKKANRNPEIIFYDVTNFYYEIEDPDEDELDEDGEVLSQGLRKMGVCKEERKQPIVQMGLFMDDNGIPIAVESFPGNTLDHLTLKTALSKNIDNAELSRFILVADRGVCNYPNILHITENGNGYIMAKSLLKSNAAERAWAYSEDGFTYESDKFKYKSRVVRKKTKDEYGQTREIAEKVVVYWSENFAKRGFKENKSFLEFLNKLMETPGNFRVTATQAKSLRRFTDKNMINAKTGEIVNSSELRAMIDKSKVDAYKRNFGYYQLVTSELTMDDKEIIDKYHGLSQIENQFHIMKGDLNTRPLFVRNPEHIKAHLLICMIALTVIRIIQNRIVKSGVVPSAEQKEVSWTMGLSSERIQRALNKWQVDLLPGDFYRFMAINDPDLKLILDAFGINIPPKFYRRADLKQIKTNINIFM